MKPMIHLAGVIFNNKKPTKKQLRKRIDELVSRKYKDFTFYFRDFRESEYKPVCESLRKEYVGVIDWDYELLSNTRQEISDLMKRKGIKGQVKAEEIDAALASRSKRGYRNDSF